MRNRQRKICICAIFAFASAMSLLAQSSGSHAARQDDLQQRAGDSGHLLLALGGGPAIGAVSSDSELPDAPSAGRSGTSAGEPAPAPAVKTSHGAPPAAMGGPLGVDRQVADWKYMSLTSAMIGASVANVELTLNCLQKHASCNDLPSSLQSRAALYGIGIPADLGVAYLTYYMKKKHSRIWYVPAAGVTVANAFLGIRAYRWSQDK